MNQICVGEFFTKFKWYLNLLDFQKCVKLTMVRIFVHKIAKKKSDIRYIRICKRFIYVCVKFCFQLKVSKELLTVFLGFECIYLLKMTNDQGKVAKNSWLPLIDSELTQYIFNTKFQIFVQKYNCKCFPHTFHIWFLLFFFSSNLFYLFLSIICCLHKRYTCFNIKNVL